MAEFLVRIVVQRPSNVDDESWSALLAEEERVGRGYCRSGVIGRIWRVPGTTANIGVWAASDASELDGLLAELPAFRHMTIGVEPLAQHYLEAQQPIDRDNAHVRQRTY